MSHIIQLYQNFFKAFKAAYLDMKATEAQTEWSEYFMEACEREI